METVQSRCLPVEDTACSASVWVYRTLPTVLLAIGTVGNSFNIFVLSRRKLRASPCFLLAILACFDILFLWSMYLQTPLRLGFDTDLTQLSEFSCKIHFWLTAWSGSASLWTVAIFTVERLLFTVLPHRTHLHIDRNKSIVLLAIIALALGIMLGVLMPFIWTVESPKGNDELNPNESTCLLSKRQASMGPPEGLVWLLVPCIILPSLIIVMGNLTLSVQLYKRRRAGTSLDAQTVLLLLVTGLLVFTIGPFWLLSFTLQALAESQILSTQIEKLLFAVIYPLHSCSFAFNFALYSWKGTLFKRECQTILKEIREFRWRCNPCM